MKLSSFPLIFPNFDSNEKEIILRLRRVCAWYFFLLHSQQEEKMRHMSEMDQ
jgi:hypothetical protein